MQTATTTVAVLDSTVAYRAAEGPGAGPTFVLLHGNPTSSYAWRHVIPALAASGRVLAPDLIGRGDSGRPDLAYGFASGARRRPGRPGGRRRPRARPRLPPRAAHGVDG